MSRVDKGPREATTQRRYTVRQATSCQASWTERERGEEGTFTLPLSLDNGVDEYTLDVDADDLDVMLKLLKRSGHTTFELERKVVMVASVDV